MGISEFFEKSSEIVYLGEITQKHLYYHKQSSRDIYLGETEHLFLESITGDKTVSELASNFSMSPQKANMLCKYLCEKGLIKGFEYRKKKTVYNVVLFSIQSKQGQNYSYKNKKISDIFFWISFLSPIVLFWWFLKYFNYIVFIDSLKYAKLSDVFVFLSIVFISFYVHETGHARFSRYAGAYVIGYDFGFISFLPCVTTVVSGLSKIKLLDRIKISLAGISNNLLLSTFAIFLFSIRPSFYMEFLIVFNVMIALFNLIIFMKTDGWQLLNILSSGIDVSSGNELVREVDEKILNRILLFLKILIAIIMASLLF